jgi:DNA-binding XRE family transcriptional regulator
VDRAEKAKRFAEIWLKSRAEAGISQETMAMELEVSKKTIQNWERGLSSPSAFQVFEWFEVLGLNPIPYLLAYQYPQDIDLDTKFHGYMNVVKKENRERLVELYESNSNELWSICLQCSLIFTMIDNKTRTLIMSQLLKAYELEGLQGKNPMINTDIIKAYLKKLNEE